MHASPGSRAPGAGIYGSTQQGASSTERAPLARLPDHVTLAPPHTQLCAEPPTYEVGGAGGGGWFAHGSQSLWQRCALPPPPGREVLNTASPLHLPEPYCPTASRFQESCDHPRGLRKMLPVRTPIALLLFGKSQDMRSTGGIKKEGIKVGT